MNDQFSIDQIANCKPLLGTAIPYTFDGSHRSDERSQVEVEDPWNSMEAVLDDLVHLQHFTCSFLRICSSGKPTVLSLAILVKFF